jgi:hypothetical protein
MQFYAEHKHTNMNRDEVNHVMLGRGESTSALHYILELLHHVVVGNDADISEVHAAPISD